MMRAAGVILAALLAGVVVFASGLATTSTHGQAQYASRAGQSAALFMQMMPMLTSPRCMNCHTATDFPRQDDDRHRHLMLIMRGADDQGSPALRCQACHLEANSPNSGVPGAPEWKLAPLSMAWEGLSAGALCRTILNPQKGKQTPDTIVAHMQTPLVQWAWSPGVDLDGKARTLPPVSSEAFIRLVRAWVDSGAWCP
jgi:hypothetical protein